MESVTLFANGALYTIPYDRMIDSFAAELGLPAQGIREALDVNCVLDVKEMHMPFAKGDILTSVSGAPASLIKDILIHAEVWTIVCRFSRKEG